MQLSYFKFVAGFIPLLTFSVWNLYMPLHVHSMNLLNCACIQKTCLENMFTSLEKKMFVFVLLYDKTCMPKIKYIKYSVLHVYTLGNYNKYYILILDYENLAFHFLLKSFHLCEFSFFSQV